MTRRRHWRSYPKAAENRESAVSNRDETEAANEFFAADAAAVGAVAD